MEIEFDLEKINPKDGMVLSTYFHLKKAQVESVVSFTLFHEVSHVLEWYNNHNYGSSNNKIHEVLAVLKYFCKNIEKVVVKLFVFHALNNYFTIS